MSQWDAEHYLSYGTERTRAAFDLAARIELPGPTTVVDLGCGPGNSTAILRARWPRADIVGIDNSEDMLRSARRGFPTGNWLLADVATWQPERPVALLYSNAALQWIPDHESLVRRLFGTVAESGALAFQIPSSTYPAVRQAIREISNEPAWRDRMEAPRSALTMNDPPFYYDALADLASRVDIWETEYFHVMDSKESIIDWISSTGLRPFLAVLDDEGERATFERELRRRVDEAYATRLDGRVLFPFRRTFVIAYR